MQNYLLVYQYDKKKRYGAKKDGGYVIAELDGGYDCYLSAGISDEESFSRDFIEKYNIQMKDSYGFDGTIENYPYQYTSNIQFIRKNIHSYNDDSNTDLSLFMETYQDIFLKMDIEGGEYPWLLKIDEAQLQKIKQIVIELHGITNDGWNCSLSDKISCLEKLSKTHYIVHAHGNNFGPVNNKIPDVIELTYVRKNYFPSIPQENKTPLPTPGLDFPNDASTSDIPLNFYPFGKPTPSSFLVPPPKSRQPTMKMQL